MTRWTVGDDFEDYLPYTETEDEAIAEYIDECESDYVFPRTIELFCWERKSVDKEDAKEHAQRIAEDFIKYALNEDTYLQGEYGNCVDYEDLDWSKELEKELVYSMEEKLTALISSIVPWQFDTVDKKEVDLVKWCKEAGDSYSGVVFEGGDQ